MFFCSCEYNLSARPGVFVALLFPLITTSVITWEPPGRRLGCRLQLRFANLLQKDAPAWKNRRSYSRHFGQFSVSLLVLPGLPLNFSPPQYTAHRAYCRTTTTFGCLSGRFHPSLRIDPTTDKRRPSSDSLFSLNAVWRQHCCCAVRTTAGYQRSHAANCCGRMLLALRLPPKTRIDATHLFLAPLL